MAISKRMLFRTILLVLLIIPAIASASGYLITLKNGSTLTATQFSSNENVVTMMIGGTVMTVPKADVSGITKIAGTINRRGVNNRVHTGYSGYSRRSYSRQNQYNVSDTIYSRCKDKWKNDYEMVEYCIGNQETAHANIQQKR